MLIKECMSKKVDLGTPNMTIIEAARKMRDGDYGILPVTENDRLVGMLTDRDLAVRAVAEGSDPNLTKVKDVMSDKVLYCYEDQSTQEVADNMGKNQVRRLPVLNRQKRLVGIVSLGDIADSHRAPEHAKDALSQISQHTHH